MNKDEVALKLEEDLTEIVGLIGEYIDKKYIGQINKEIKGYRQECESEMCKEGQLIKAMIPFANDKAPMLQTIIDIMMYNDIIEKGFEKHEDLGKLYRDDNKDKQEIKKLVYKLILFKIITMIEKRDYAH